MIELTPEADTHLARLTEHYETLNRQAAAENLLKALEAAKLRIVAAPGKGIDAPRPYPQLKRLGFLWVIERGYWISYTRTTPVMITSIFHESADIPRWF